MKLSALQLTRYVVTNIGCTADPKFNPDKEIVGALDQLSVNVKANQLEPKKDVPSHSWSVELEVTQKKTENQNIPYEFHIAIFGIFTCLDCTLEAEKETQFVQVNGSSMLYAIAREQIRALTAASPWGAVTLPTMSFYDKKEQPNKEETPAPKSQT